MSTGNQQSPEYSVVVLCYGSGNHVCDFAEEVTKFLLMNDIFDYQLVLVGNYLENSRDQTPEIVRRLAIENPRIVSVTRKKEGMMGWDMKTGLAAATGKYISVIDGDGQMPAEDIVKVYKKIKEEDYDLVKTVRVIREDGIWRKFISRIFNGLFRLLFPTVRSKDINSKPKIFSRATYEEFNLQSDDWFIDAEIMIEAGRLGLKVGEVPTWFKPSLRKSGSFINFFAFLEFIRNLIRYRIILFWDQRK